VSKEHPHQHQQLLHQEVGRRDSACLGARRLRKLGIFYAVKIHALDALLVRRSARLGARSRRYLGMCYAVEMHALDAQLVEVA